jgi:hypothetical protein
MLRKPTFVAGVVAFEHLSGHGPSVAVLRLMARAFVTPEVSSHSPRVGGRKGRCGPASFSGPAADVAWRRPGGGKVDGGPIS